jgi:uncharacterized membrane protein
MRYDGYGMGGATGGITILVLSGLALFMVLAAIHSRRPRLIESLIGSLVTIAVGGFWLAIFALVVVTISIPVAGALDLDRDGQMVSWLPIAIALYFIGARIK